MPASAVEVLAVHEVALRLRVSERHVRRMIADGRLQSRRLGSRVLVTTTDVAALLDAAKAKRP